LKSLFTENRADFEAKWNDIKIVLNTECYLRINSTKSRSFVLYPTVDEYYTLDELKENLKENKPIKMVN
jgi:molecular chaperone HtpG